MTDQNDLPHLGAAFTDSEFFRLANLPLHQSVLNRIDSMIVELQEANDLISTQQETHEEAIELLEEQVSFRNEFIENVMSEVNGTGTKLELRTYMNQLLEDSYIEL